MKIAFTGPESTGKTSLSKIAAKQINAKWFPEIAREYLIKKGGSYQFEDLEKIALLQEESRVKHKQNNIHVYDTENLVLYVWSIFKYKKCSKNIVNLMNSQKYDHYFICHPADVPWEDDPLRENPLQREELFEIYLDLIQQKGWNFTILKGDFDKRLKKVNEVIGNILIKKRTKSI